MSDAIVRHDMTTITVRYMTIKDPLGLARTRWYICENGKPTGYYGYDSQAEAEKQARAMATIRTGRYAGVQA